LEGKVPGSFDEYCISTTVGVVAPHTLRIIEDAVKVFASTKLVHAGIFLAHDGIYLAERTIAKISGPVEKYWTNFQSGTTPYIEPSSMHLSYAWVDYGERTVHFALPINFTGPSTTQTTLNRELVYNYFTNEWYDLHRRPSAARCGMSYMTSDNHRLVYYGDHAGKVFRSGVSNNDSGVQIEHYLKTADVIPHMGTALLSGGDSHGNSFLHQVTRLQSVRVKAKSSNTGYLELGVFADGSGVSTVINNRIPLFGSTGYSSSKTKTGTNAIIAESYSLRFRSGVSSEDIGNGLELYGYTIEVYPERLTGGP
jgi:hypothetical protein